MFNRHVPKYGRELKDIIKIMILIKDDIVSIIEHCCYVVVRAL